MAGGLSEESDSCPGPLALTGRPFSSICCSRPPLPGKQAFSSGIGQSDCSRRDTRLSGREEAGLLEGLDRWDTSRTFLTKVFK